jgi:hypothetical protein
METLLLKHDYKVATAKLRGKHPAPSHVDQTIDRDTVVIAPDGSIPVVLLKRRIDPVLCNPISELWKTVDELPSNRATAVGSSSLPRPRSDGTLSERRVVPKFVLEVLKAQGVRHGILGYLGATPDQPCHETPLTVARPELLGRSELLVKRVDRLYAQFMPRCHAKQQAVVDQVPRWRLWDTAFTTIYIAKNFRTAYHRDTGNMRGVMSALMPTGRFTGGELILPCWRIAIAFIPGDLLLFDPQQLHGNLPFEGERLSAIFYCADGIADEAAAKDRANGRNRDAR